MKKIFLILAILIAMISLSKAAYYQAYAEASASHPGNSGGGSVYYDVHSVSYNINEIQNATFFVGAWSNGVVNPFESESFAQGSVYGNSGIIAYNDVCNWYPTNEISVSTGRVFIKSVYFYVWAGAPMNPPGAASWSRASLSW